MKRLFIVVFSILIAVSGIRVDYAAQSTQKYYAVQTGSFEKKDSMEVMMNSLRQKGYRPYWRSEGDRYKLFVGSYSSRGQAEAAAASMKANGVEGFVKERVKYVSAVSASKSTASKAESYQAKTTVAVQSASTESAKVQSEQSQIQQKSKNFKREKDITIQGVYGSDVFFFEVQKNWAVAGAYLNLVFSQSQLENAQQQDYNDSTLTVYINDFPVYSMDINNMTSYKEQIRVELPPDKIKAGFNEVRIGTYKRVMELPCKDDLNPANWIALHKESYIHVDFTDAQDSPAISDYPYPYLKQSDSEKRVSIVVPDNFTSAQMKAACIIASDIGKRVKYENVNVSISTVSQEPSRSGKDIIFVGGISNSPSEIVNKLSEHEKSSVGKGAIIKETDSVYSDSANKMLMIVSDDDGSLENAVKAMFHDELVSQMNSSVQFIPQGFEAEGKGKDESEQVKLKTLGYSDVLLEGLFRQQATFGFNVHKGRKLADGASIDLRFRYSKALDFEKSVMTVYLNDIPIGSKKLEMKNADNDSFKVTIPDELKNSSYYELKVAFDLNMDDQFCNMRPQTASWAFISSESYAYMPYEYKEYPLLEDYAAPFIKDSQTANTTIVLPDNPSAEELSLVGRIAAYFGHSSYSPGKLNFARSSEFSDEAKSSDLIVIGTPERNSVVRDLNKYLNVGFDKAFKKFVSNEDVKILDKYSSELSTIQLVDSPYNSGKRVLVLTGCSDRAVADAGMYLTDIEMAAKMAGDTMLVDEQGLVRCEYVSEKAKDAFEKRTGEADQSADSEKRKAEGLNPKAKSFILFVALMTLIVVTASILIIRKGKRWK